MKKGKSNAKHRYHREKGAITVMLSLLLVPVMLFTGLMVDFSRVKLCESQAVFSADLYANSILASYNDELYDMYALFGFTSSEQLESELANIAANSFNGGSFNDSQGVMALAQLIHDSYSESEDKNLFIPYKNAEVAFNYSVAENTNNMGESEKGTLGNNGILKTQISDYTITRLPTFVAETAMDGGISDVEEIMAAVETVKNLDKYSKITAAKGKLDAKLEVYFNYLTAFHDDLYSLSESNFAKSSDFAHYETNYGIYGLEQVEDIVGKYDYSGKGVPSIKYCDGQTYLGSIGKAVNTINDYSEKIDKIIDEIDNYYEAEDGKTSVCEEKMDQQKRKLDAIINELTSTLNSGSGFYMECGNELVDFSNELYKLAYRVNVENAYSSSSGALKMKNLKNDKSFLELAAGLDSRKSEINDLIYTLNNECQEAIKSGCDEETVNSMISDYSQIQKLTSDDFSYSAAAQKYLDFYNKIMESALGADVYSIYGQRSISSPSQLAGATQSDYKLLAENIEHLKDRCGEGKEFADAQKLDDGLADKSTYITTETDVDSIKKYQAYLVDQYDLFGHSSIFTPDTSSGNMVFGLNDVNPYYMSKDEENVKLVLSFFSGESGEDNIKIKDIYEYIHSSCASKNVNANKQNSVLKKAKKLINGMDDVSLDVYDENPIIISEPVNSALSSTVAAKERKNNSLTGMLNNIDSFFPDINPSDMITNTVLMFYDYNMFSCDTTDKVKKENSNENNLSGDKQPMVSGGKLQLGEGDVECSPLTNLANGTSNESGSGTKSGSKNLFYDERTEKDREESMTDQVYHDTSMLYRCELEYLYAGNSTMQKNLDNARLSIMAERMVFNYMSTYTTTELNNILNGIKAAISAAFTPAVGIVTDGVLRLALATIETNSDMTQLLSAGKVVLIKSSFDQFSSYEMIKDVLGDMAGDSEELNTDTGFNQKKENNFGVGNSKGGTSKFPEIRMSYKQYLMLNVLLFVDKDYLLDRTRDLIDLNVNKMEKNLEIKNDNVVFCGGADAGNPKYFRVSNQITVIDAECSVQMSPLFTYLGLNRLTDESDEVNDFLSDKRTYSVIKGY